MRLIKILKKVVNIIGFVGRLQSLSYTQVS